MRMRVAFALRWGLPRSWCGDGGAHLSGTLYPADHCTFFSAWVNLAQRVTYVLLPKPVVMIGNMLLEPAATHNQTLPTITFESLLGLRNRMVFLVLWCQGLPDFTIAYQPVNLGKTSGLIAFTSRRSPLGGITHSGLDYVLCWVIMDYDVDAMTGTCMT